MSAAAPARLRWLPTVLVLALGTLWGAHFSIVKSAAESGLPIGGIIAATAFGAAMLLLGICLIRQRLPPVSRPHLWFYFICALLSYGLPFLLELIVAQFLAASLLAIIVMMDPVFTTAIATLARKESATLKRMLGLGFGALASLMILLPGTVLPAPELLGWTLLAFAVPMSYAVYHNYVAAAWPAKLDSWQAGTGEAVVSSVIFLPAALWYEDLSALRSHWSAGHWAIVLMVLSGVLEAYLYFEIVRRAGAVFVSQAGFVTVVTGILWGMIVFGELPNSWFWLSTICLIYSLYLTRIDEKPVDAVPETK